MAAYRMTPARRRALRKAQMASARKRRGKGKGKLAAANRRATRNKRIAIGTGLAAGAAIGAVVYTNRGGPAGKVKRLESKAKDYNFKANVSRSHSRKSSGTLQKRFTKNAMRYSKQYARTNKKIRKIKGRR